MLVYISFDRVDYATMLRGLEQQKADTMSDLNMFYGPNAGYVSGTL